MIYICSMKKILFIFGVLLGILLLAPQEDSWQSNDDLMAATQEAIMQERSVSDVQHQLEILGNELQSSSCLTPRRNIQAIGFSFELRIYKNAEKVLQYIRLKGENRLCRTSENVSAYQSINFSALLCRMGYHIYALRKIII